MSMNLNKRVAPEGSARASLRSAGVCPVPWARFRPRCLPLCCQAGVSTRRCRRRLRTRRGAIDVDSVCSRRPVPDTREGTFVPVLACAWARSPLPRKFSASGKRALSRSLNSFSSAIHLLDIYVVRIFKIRTTLNIRTISRRI